MKSDKESGDIVGGLLMLPFVLIDGLGVLFGIIAAFGIGAGVVAGVLGWVLFTQWGTLSAGAATGMCIAFAITAIGFGVFLFASILCLLDELRNRSSRRK